MCQAITVEEYYSEIVLCPTISTPSDLECFYEKKSNEKKEKYIQYKPGEIKAINVGIAFQHFPTMTPKMYDNLYASNFSTLYYQYESVRL